MPDAFGQLLEVGKRNLAAAGGPGDLCQQLAVGRNQPGFDRVRINRESGGVLAGLAREGTPVSRIQWLERTVPADGDEIGRYLGECWARDSVPVDSLAMQSYLQLTSTDNFTPHSRIDADFHSPSSRSVKDSSTPGSS